jgi:hypothetical protein
MPLKAPTLPRNTIEARLSAAALTAQDIGALFRNEECIAIESRNAQLVFVEEFAQKGGGVTFDTTYLADAFDPTRSRIRTIRAKAQKKQRPSHRPLTLSNKQELQLCEMIQEKAITGNYVTKRELLNDVEVNFHIILTYDWIRCFLERLADFVKKQLRHQVNCQDFKSCANI